MTLPEGLQSRFVSLFAAHEPAIRAYLRRLLPTRADAADVMQDLALVLWKKFPECERPDEFRRWAFGVVRYEALAWRRDRARDRLVLAEDVLDLLADESERLDGVLDAQREAVEQCLSRLPSSTREAVLSAYSAGTTMEQSAQRSGKTPNAFHQWLYRIRLALLDCARRTLAAGGNA